MDWPWSRKMSPAEIPNALQRADQAYKAGNSTMAVRLYRRVLKADDRNLAALVNLGGILSQTPKRRDEALELMKQAKEIAPENPTVLLNLAAIHAYGDRLDEAFVLLNQLEDLDEKYPGLKYNRANVLFRMGRVRDAFVEIQEELRDNPDNLHAVMLQEALRRRMETQGADGV